MSIGARRRTYQIAVVLCALISCAADKELEPFSSDGCSLFPDASLMGSEDWCSCCFEHDIAYWKGGTADERLVADHQLRTCVLEKTGDGVLAEAMYHGVRFGGSPHFYNWYRWGYGWSYDRRYTALTPAEATLADKLFAQYRAENPLRVCE